MLFRLHVVLRYYEMKMVGSHCKKGKKTYFHSFPVSNLEKKPSNLACACCETCLGVICRRPRGSV